MVCMFQLQGKCLMKLCTEEQAQVGGNKAREHLYYDYGHDNDEAAQM